VPLSEQQGFSIVLNNLFHLPQIIHEADKIYGVSHSSRISRIDVVTREDALDFVHANLQEHEGNQGDKDRDTQ